MLGFRVRVKESRIGMKSVKDFQSNNKGEVVCHLFLLLTYPKAKVTKYLTVSLSEGKVSHNQEGFCQLLEEITGLPETPEIIFEATGVYSRQLEKFCQDNR